MIELAGHRVDRAVDPLAVAAHQVGDPVGVRRAVLRADRGDRLEREVGAPAADRRGGRDRGGKLVAQLATYSPISTANTTTAAPTPRSFFANTLPGPPQARHAVLIAVHSTPTAPARVLFLDDGARRLNEALIYSMAAAGRLVRGAVAIRSGGRIGGPGARAGRRPRSTVLARERARSRSGQAPPRSPRAHRL